MDSHDNLRGAEANPSGAVATQIAALQLQVAELTQRLQSAVKIEVVSDADKQSVKDALGNLDGGEIFNEAVAVQYSQAKMQQQQTQSWSMFRLTSPAFQRLNENTSGCSLGNWGKWTGVLSQ